MQRANSADSTTLDRALSTANFSSDLQAAAETHRRVAEENRRIWVEWRRNLVALNAVTAERDALRKSVEDLRAELHTLKLANADLQQAVVKSAKLESELAFAEERLQREQDEKRGFQELNAEKGAKLEEQQEELEAMKAEHDELYRAIDESGKKAEALMKELAASSAELQRVKAAAEDEKTVAADWAARLDNTKRLLETRCVLIVQPISSAKTKEKYDECVQGIRSFNDSMKRDVEHTRQGEAGDTVFATQVLDSLVTFMVWAGRILDERNDFACRMGGGGAASSGSGGAAAAAGAASPGGAAAAPKPAQDATGLTFWKARVPTQ